MTRPAGTEPQHADADDASGTVARVIRLLRHVAETGGSLSVKSIAASLSLPSSTVHRQLQLLARAGLVEHDEVSHTYRAGREFFRIASLVVQQFDVGPVVRPVLEALRDETGETCFFTMYLPAAREATIVEVARSPHPLRYQVDRFTHIPLAWGSLGRSILAHLGEADIEAIVAASGPAPATGRALPGIAALRAELGRIRRQGYALSKGQNIAGAVGLASAVFDGRHAVVGAIGLTMPEARFTGDVPTRFPGRVAEHARRVSTALGWRDDAAPERPAAPRGRRRAIDGG